MITVYHHVSCVLTLWRERVNIVTSIVGLMIFGNIYDHQALIFVRLANYEP